MQRLTDIITIDEGEIVTLVGSGGKTTFMWLLAERYRQSRMLVTTTTKIVRPGRRFYDAYRDSRTLFGLPTHKGITLAGEVLAGEDRGKLGCLDPETLEKGRTLFDRILVEGDGSRQFPLKGWADHEPVVPRGTSCTIGIVTLWPLGKPIDELLVFRLPLFCRISGACEGDLLTLDHIKAVIAHPYGLWKESRGRRILMINQVEDKGAWRLARKLVRSMNPVVLQSLSLVIAGSARDDQGEIMWSREEI